VRSCWGHAVSIAAHAITIMLHFPRASTFWRKQSARDTRWRIFHARVAARVSCTSTPAVLDARSGRVPTRGTSNTAACATSSPAIGYRLSRATAEFTTVMYWPIWRNWQRMVQTNGSPTRHNAGGADVGPGLAGTNGFVTTVVYRCVPMGLVQHRRHMALACSTQICQPWTPDKSIRRLWRGGGKWAII
jgi:hypothetical protein